MKKTYSMTPPQKDGKEIKDPNVLEFLKANFHFELEQIYVEELNRFRNDEPSFKLYYVYK